MDFEYFHAPMKDMDLLCLEQQVCSLCGKSDWCFDLKYAICPELPDSRKEGRVGCLDCLHFGRFEFWHDTDIGVLDEEGLKKEYKHNQNPPADFPEAALIALRRTPRILTWQQELWLSHCNDFMIYQGVWLPRDFYANSPDGDGKNLFLRMTKDYQNL